MIDETPDRPRLSEADRARADAHLERTLEPLDGLSDKIDIGGGPAPIPRTEAVREQAGGAVPAGPVMGTSASHAAQLSSDLHAQSGHPTLAERIQREGFGAQYGQQTEPDELAKTRAAATTRYHKQLRGGKRKKRRQKGKRR